MDFFFVNELKKLSLQPNFLYFMNELKKLKFILYMRSIKLSKISAYTPAFSLVLSYTIFLFGVIYTMDGQAQQAQQPAQQQAQQPDLTPATDQERADYLVNLVMCHSAGLMDMIAMLTCMAKFKNREITKADCAAMLAKARDEATKALNER